MPATTIRFEDGASYERMMGRWSRIAGSALLDWVKPERGLRWLDVGCGNGASTALLMERCVPAAVTGIDASEAQLDFARARPATRGATFTKGDALELPFPDASFDAALSALVLFFLPDPQRGAAEMLRVVRPGGILCAYVWDILGGGLPHEILRSEMRAMGMSLIAPPTAEVSKLQALQGLAESAGWSAVEAKALEIERTFDDFEDLWDTNILGNTIRDQVQNLPPAQREELRSRVKARCRPDSKGRITLNARANAVKGWRRV